MKPALATTRPDARSPAFTWALRVYWEDTDAGGVVFYANHLKFFERARTEWLRAAGISQQALHEAEGLIFIVAETSVRYLAPAKLDDLLHITVQPQPAGRASIELLQQAWRGETLLAEGRIRIGCVQASNFRPARLPAAVCAALAPAAAPPSAVVPTLEMP